jgi:hypothetical protein
MLPFPKYGVASNSTTATMFRHCTALAVSLASGSDYPTRPLA